MKDFQKTIIDKAGLIFFISIAILILTQNPILGKTTRPPEINSSSHTVTWEKVKISSPQSSVSYPGNVSACKKTKLAFRVSGPLVQVNVKPGDMVKKDQLLMQIDPQDFRDQIAVLKAQLEGAKSRLTTSRLDLKRARTLFDQKVIPQADYDHTVNGQQIALAQVSQIKAQLTIAKHYLDYTSLKAPYDGIIIDTKIENHEMVSAGHPAVILHDISTLEIIAGIPENELIRHPLSSESNGIVKFPALGNQQFSVKLKEWKTTADPATKTFDLTFSLKAPEKFKILPGMTAELMWSNNNQSGKILTIPTKAIIMNNNNTSMVWVYNSDTRKAHKQNIVTRGFYGANHSIVVQGLGGNEKIITQGMDFITKDMNLAPMINQEGQK